MNLVKNDSGAFMEDAPGPPSPRQAISAWKVSPSMLVTTRCTAHTPSRETGYTTSGASNVRFPNKSIPPPTSTSLGDDDGDGGDDDDVVAADAIECVVPSTVVVVRTTAEALLVNERSASRRWTAGVGNGARPKLGHARTIDATKTTTIDDKRQVNTVIVVVSDGRLVERRVLLSLMVEHREKGGGGKTSVLLL